MRKKISAQIMIALTIRIARGIVSLISLWDLVHINVLTEIRIENLDY